MSRLGELISWGQDRLIASVGEVLFIVGGLVALSLSGCQAPTPPTDSSGSYDRLVRLTAAEARARNDSTFLWLRNNQTPEARRLMLDLGLDFVRYDRDAGVICMWSGGGIGPAVGYGYRMPDRRMPVDSIGEVCYRQGSCEVNELEVDPWVQFRCW